MVMIEIENIKKFMAGFLGGNLFDDFLMSEGKCSSTGDCILYWSAASG